MDVRSMFNRRTYSCFSSLLWQFARFCSVVVKKLLTVQIHLLVNFLSQKTLVLFLSCEFFVL